MDHMPGRSAFGSPQESSGLGGGAAPKRPHGQHDSYWQFVKAEFDEFMRPVLKLRPIFRLPLAAFLLFFAIGLPLIPAGYRWVHEGCQIVLFILYAIWMTAIYRIRKRNAQGS